MSDNDPSSPLVELAGVGKNFGNIIALSDVSFAVRPAEVSCILGDNGAGKSTLIKIISGLHQHSTGSYRVDGEPVKFTSPRDALDRGIATVYQDLALVPLMPVWRNFFLGSELTSGVWPFRQIRAEEMRATADAELKAMGIEVPDINQPVNTLSGGQRQVLAIARAIHFGARVLILDEPTAALGVKQAGVVLKYISSAREAGLGVILISHNPHHAYLVGDHFTVLKQGTVDLSAPRSELALDELTHYMAGGAELETLQHELRRMDPPDVGAVHELSESR
ncbi:monosaccharide ABC transporter ATP-binding protein, CUT2 family [Haloechinothrix alba]|uniref:Monosaccharide ABC transporter ATP-binding protein, CUT2 family n=1 Tax=Haloechinothrix alba TaxID=664784 RepID=A0A238W2I0_9PSEU|nr:ATP-binding cassette domain-containing protein [Haloechinothrix alba]SNR40736.1 monosaccharide ABC transporter ATP-binding protein, CUT2 family [Haloechinothrix alba]